MEYLQYSLPDSVTIFIHSLVLNLIINGIPSILKMVITLRDGSNKF